MESNSRNSSRSLIWVLPAGLILITIVVIIRTAWLGDDAYISFRVIENFVNGYGLRWNVVERVQAFTHPLWVLLLTGAYIATGEIYYTSIIVSVALSSLSLIVVGFGVSRSAISAALGITLLLFSRAFIDYSTSGLENPLTYLLVAIFAWMFLTREWSSPSLGQMSLVAALSAVNRLDTILLFAVPLGVMLLDLRTKRAVRVMLLGFLPLIAWELFSITYYGFPLPNTYYAKLHTGISQMDLFRQGLLYCWHTLNADPLTILGVVAGIVVAIITRKRKTLALISGVILYLLYIVRIGGDFIQGRLFAVPLLLCAILIVRIKFERSWMLTIGAFASVLLVGLNSPKPPIRSDSTYGERREERSFSQYGIADERAYYYHNTGFLLALSGEPMPKDWGTEGTKLRSAERTVVSNTTIGAIGYTAGPHVHINGAYGLADALLARLPMDPRGDWRIGHPNRTMPAGYLETIISGENQIDDSALSRYWDKLALVTQGSLLTCQRWRAIWDINTGAADHLIQSYCCPPAIDVDYANVSRPIPTGTPEAAPSCRRLRRNGIRIRLPGLTHTRSFEMAVDSDDNYGISYYRNTERLDWQRLPARPLPDSSMRVWEITVPQQIAADGYDMIHIQPETGDDHYAFGHLLLYDEK